MKNPAAKPRTPGLCIECHLHLQHRYMYPQALVQKKPGSKAKIIENCEGASSYTLGSYSVCALELQGSARTTSPELTADLSLSFPHLATLF